MFKRIVLGVLSVLLLWLAWEWITFPDVEELATKKPGTTAFMKRRSRELRAAGKDNRLLHQWVPYERIAPNLRRAVLIAEDDTFYEHGGVDVEAMRDALERNWKRKKVTHGGSTITQQLAKNLYLSPSRNPIRKIREYLITRALEKHLSKKRILEIYLNVVELGERVYGAEAAARYYFKVPAAGLTLQQAALLAGSLPNPRVMNPGRPNKRLRARQRMIISRMRRWGHLAERELLTERRRPDKAPAGAVTAPLPVTTESPVSEMESDVQTETATETAPAETETAPPVPTETSGTTDTSDISSTQ